MVIVLWTVVVIVAANILVAALLLVRFRAETKRMAEACHCPEREPRGGAG
jgi:hypothetical protein